MSNNQDPTIGAQLEGLFDGIFGGKVLNNSVSDTSRKVRNPIDDDTIEGNISNATNEQVGLGAGIIQGVRNFFVGLSEVFGVGAQFFGKFFEGLSNGNFAGTMTGFSADLVNSGRDRPQRLLDRYNENGITPDVDPSVTQRASAPASDAQGAEVQADGADVEGQESNPARTVATVGGTAVGALAGGATGMKLGAGMGAAAGAFFGGIGAVPGAIIGGAIGTVGGAVLGSGAGGFIAYHGTNIVQGAWNGITSFVSDPAGSTTTFAQESANELVDNFVNDSPLSLTIGGNELFRVPSLSEMGAGISSMFSSEESEVAAETPTAEAVSSVPTDRTQDVAVNLIRSTFSGATGQDGVSAEMTRVMADARNMFDAGGIASGATQISALSNDGPFKLAAVHSTATPEWARPEAGANFNSKLELTA